MYENDTFSTSQKRSFCQETKNIAAQRCDLMVHA
jgi:hypothetical protein